MVDDETQVIYVFQSKIIQNKNRTIGDSLLKEFYGSLSQFNNNDSVTNLEATAKGTRLKKLLKEGEVAKKVSENYEVKGVFVVNSEIDSNGSDFLKGAENVDFIGIDYLSKHYISNERQTRIKNTLSVSTSIDDFIKYETEKKVSAYVGLLKASELISMPGLSDQSVFDFNVRGPLGRTKVNKAITASIKNQDTHEQFPLFHNGLTIICEKVEIKGGAITIKNFYVVNGCQSLTSLLTNSSSISDKLKILTRIVEIPSEDSAIRALITEYTNNQNPVRARDMRSNDPAQIRLQNEFNNHYKDKFFFDIKAGDNFLGKPEIIGNSVAGLCLIAFDKKMPWATHRQYQVFQDLYKEIFYSSSSTAHKIVLCYLIYKISESIISEKIENQGFVDYPPFVGPGIKLGYHLLCPLGRRRERSDRSLPSGLALV